MHDPNDPIGRLLFNVLAMIAESDLIRMRTREGMKVAKANASAASDRDAADDVPISFTEFFRGQYATDDGGTGLGLASLKHLVELQGGTVRMNSTPGVGTTVIVELRRAVP